ncbi:MAG: glycosyltransferase family 2 protein [Prevotella sp.]|nr:glycosyltransferase family 2 protein [Prevotella sp.]
MEIKISIITINYNGLIDTCALIDSITFDDTLEVIVVDNGSKKDEATIIEQRYPHVTVVRSPQNLGFAGGNNLGIQAAHGKYLFFINNDTIIRGEGGEMRGESILQPLIDRLESSDKIGMVCPKIRFAWGTNPIQFAGYTPLSSVTMRNRGIGCGEEDHGQYDIPHPTPYAHGAAMMVRREALEKVGMMPECYFLYYEELDWSMMFTRSGYEIWYEPRFTIYHKESQATGQNSPLKTYYLTRNRLLFAHRNIPIPRRFLTYLYLMGLVSLRDIVKHIIQGRKDLAASVTRGLRDFIKRPKE